ncbi:Mga-like protein with HTH domain/DNA binding protein with HTH domain [Bacillus thuringiensis]
MNSFLYSFIHDKGIRRKISILEILSTNPDYVTSNFIANYLKCSSRTILNDISELKKDLPTNWNLISLKSKGHILTKPLNENFNLVIYSYLKESIIYKIMVRLFNGEYYTLEKWSQILYVNKVTLKNILQKFNKTLRQSGIRLTFRVIKLEGNEINIRYFYATFFYLLQKYTNEFEKKFSLRKKIKGILEMHNVNMNFNLLASNIYVFITRNLQKYHTKRKIETNCIFDSNQLKCLKKILSLMEEHYKFKFNKNERKFLNVCFFLTSKRNSEQKNKIFNHYDIKRNSYKNYYMLFKMIEAKNKNHKQIQRQLAYELGLYICKIEMLNKYQLPVQYLTNSIEHPSRECIKLYKQNHSIIFSWNKLYNNGKYTKYEVKYLSIYTTLFLYSNPTKIHVLLKFSGTVIEENNVCLNLKQGLGKRVEIHMLENKVENYDYIITNYRVEKKGIPIFYIFQNGSSKEINAIKEMII